MQYFVTDFDICFVFIFFLRFATVQYVLLKISLFGETVLIFEYFGLLIWCRFTSFLCLNRLQKHLNHVFANHVT